MIHKGDIVWVRTYTTKRKTRALVLYVNYKHGWYTAEIQTPKGKYNEMFFIREIEGEDEDEVEKKKEEWAKEDDPYNWLDEWSEGKYGK